MIYFQNIVYCIVSLQTRDVYPATMLEHQGSGVKMPHTHRISFSILDILDPNKFTYKNQNNYSPETRATGTRRLSQNQEETLERVAKNGAETDWNCEDQQRGKEKQTGIILMSCTAYRILEMSVSEASVGEVIQ